MRIVTENLSYVYSEKSKELAVQALNNISLTIEEGEFFGINRDGVVGDGEILAVSSVKPTDAPPSAVMTMSPLYQPFSLGEGTEA